MDQFSSTSLPETPQIQETGESTKRTGCSENWPVGRIRRPTTNSTNSTNPLPQSLQERFSGTGLKMENVDGDMELVITADNLDAVLYEAYNHMTTPELELLLTLRTLRSTGTRQELLHRLVEHEVRRYSRSDPRTSRFSPSAPINGPTPTSRPQGNPEKRKRLANVVKRVPQELWSDILEYVQDWELAQALGIRTRDQKPGDWFNATPLDYALLSGSTARIKEVMVEGGEGLEFSEPSAHAIVRFGYVNVLDYLFRHHRKNFRKIFEADAPLPNDSAMRMQLPWLASRYGHVQVLDWWLANSDPERLDGLSRKYDKFSLNTASQFGHVKVLDWWKNSGLPLEIGDVMDFATIGGHIDVLEWWLRSGYNTNLMQRDALGIASAKGKIEILDWFKNAGIQLNYEYDVLNLATRYNKPEVLQWWSDSGLRAEYVISDIQEAVEECHETESRDWWSKRGVTFEQGRSINPDEWFKPRVLRPIGERST
ncbi:hypothetical protein BJ508DRAFT_412439 [Ascobolus immersus RN42]|uniref:SAP domain-containing protein n=1 Tax=Ascobolus immersus RN42 TaxID=1160509 RepID=A0A3N4IGX3_ASCIM|nr:hypothetical protein BJ508DRAFT_412439 [Ascobolus immersus RN42]